MSLIKNKYVVPTSDPAKRISVIASPSIFNSIENKVYSQAENVRLSYGVKDVVLMPDTHEGYFVPIGSVVAVDEHILYPGAVGVDISCGMRLLLTNYSASYLRDLALREKLLHELDRSIPTGTYVHKKPLISSEDLWQILWCGINAIENTFPMKKAGRVERKYYRDNERMSIHDFKDIVEKYLSGSQLSRARASLGTLGSGNHFIELQRVEELYSETEELAHSWGLFPGQFVVMVHSGSRNFGKVIADAFIKNSKKEQGLLVSYFREMGIDVLDPSGQYVDSRWDNSLYREYASLMSAAANFGVSNRHAMQYLISNVLKGFFPDIDVELLYDINHNIAVKERLKDQVYNVHRKGATRALPAGHEELNGSEWENTGHPVILPGNMGSASYIMVGAPAGIETYYSINHGAGRVISRSEARRTINLQQEEKIMSDIPVNLKSIASVIDETSACYKDIDDIADSVTGAGIAKRVARLVPIGVMKGT